MKNKMVILVAFVSLQANAKMIEVNVCGKHKVSNNGKHFLQTKSGNLPTGLYEVFASNPRAATKLESMKESANYCITGNFETERPEEGISLVAIR